MQKKTKHKTVTKNKMRESALKRDNTNRIKALPKKENHWNWTESPSKLTMHKRIHRAYGRASDRNCVKCNSKARDWALIGKNYSSDIKSYQPMCRKCHTNLDKGWLKRNPKCYIRNKNSKGQFAKKIRNE